MGVPEHHNRLRVHRTCTVGGAESRPLTSLFKFNGNIVHFVFEPSVLKLHTQNHLWSPQLTVRRTTAGLREPESNFVALFLKNTLPSYRNEI